MNEGLFYCGYPFFSHADIIKYANRPFLKEGDLLGDGDIDKRPWASQRIKQDRCDWMDRTLIKNWNRVVSPEDIVYHLGDFGFLNSEGYVNYMNKLNGHIILFQGNHDAKNRIKCYLISGMLYFGGKSVYVLHHPPQHFREIPQCDFIISGHVHNKYKHKFILGSDIPIINLSVEMWNYEPVSTLSLLKYYDKVKSGVVDCMGNKVVNDTKERVE